MVDPDTPPDDAVPLAEALERYVDVGHLTVDTAAVARRHSRRQQWADRANGPSPAVPPADLRRAADRSRQRAMHDDFRRRWAAGELGVWGIEGSPVGKRRELPGDAAPYARLYPRRDQLAVVAPGAPRVEFYCVFVARAAAPAAPQKRGRPSLEEADAPLLDEMRVRVLDGLSPWAAAGELAGRAAGGGTLESRQKRLHAGYLKKFGRQLN